MDDDALRTARRGRPIPAAAILRGCPITPAVIAEGTAPAIPRLYPGLPPAGEARHRTAPFSHLGVPPDNADAVDLELVLALCVHLRD